MKGCAMENKLGKKNKIIRALGELPPGAIIYEEGMADIFERCTESVKRAVQRGEIPPGIRLFGQVAWLAGSVIDYIRKRLDASVREAERDRKRLSEKEG
jgi:hypothetical protein